MSLSPADGSGPQGRSPWRQHSACHHEAHGGASLLHPAAGTGTAVITGSDQVSSTASFFTPLSLVPVWLPQRSFFSS